MHNTKTNIVRQGKTNDVTQNSFYNLTTLDKTIGTIFLEARKKTGLTQEQLADLAKISKPYVGTIENMRPHPDSGALPKPERAKIIRIVKVLNSKLPEDEQLDLDKLLLMFGHAPEKAPVLPPGFVVADFDGFDKDDLQDIGDYIRFKKAQKEKQKQS